MEGPGSLWTRGLPPAYGVSSRPVRSEGRLPSGPVPRSGTTGATMSTIHRRTFLAGALASGAGLVVPPRAAAGVDLQPVHAEVERRHGEAVARLQEWIRQPSIAAEGRGMAEGCDLQMQL